MKTKFPFFLFFFFSVYSLQAQLIKPKKDGNRYVFVNYNGKKVFKERYEDAKGFSDGFAAVANDGKWGFINEEGELAVPYRYDEAGYFYGPSAIVKSADKYYLINGEGKTLTEESDSVFYANKHFAFLQNELWGITDSLGTEIVSAKYQDVNPMYDGKMPVKLNDEWGLWENGMENFDNPDIVFSRPEKMPLFSAKCQSEKEYKEQKDCADLEMLKFIYKSIKYPALAREDGIQGMVVIQFIIDEQGQLLNPVLKREIGGGCDEESMRVVKAMPKWAVAGFQDGKSVKTVFNLPIRFRLE